MAEASPGSSPSNEELWDFLELQIKQKIEKRQVVPQEPSYAGPVGDVEPREIIGDLVESMIATISAMNKNEVWSGIMSYLILFSLLFTSHSMLIDQPI